MTRLAAVDDVDSRPEVVITNRAVKRDAGAPGGRIAAAQVIDGRAGRVEGFDLRVALGAGEFNADGGGTALHDEAGAFEPGFHVRACRDIADFACSLTAVFGEAEGDARSSGAFCRPGK